MPPFFSLKAKRRQFDDVVPDVIRDGGGITPSLSGQMLLLEDMIGHVPPDYLKRTAGHFLKRSCNRSECFATVGCAGIQYFKF